MDFERFNKTITDKYSNIFLQKSHFNSVAEITKFTCEKHGEMKIMPMELFNNGCPKCLSYCIHTEGICHMCEGEYKNFDELVVLLKQVHSVELKYKYKKKDDNTTSLICLRHGYNDFDNNDLLKGKVCIYCDSEEIQKRNVFINKMINKYGYIYDYSLVDYKNINTKIMLKTSEGIIINIAPKTILS